MPEQAPVASDVDWESLGKGYQLAGGSIKQAVVRAATQAALRIEVGCCLLQLHLHNWTQLLLDILWHATFCRVTFASYKTMWTSLATAYASHTCMRWFVVALLSC